MFKACVFIALLSLAAAAPSIVGPIVGPAVVPILPAAISHSSITQLHARPVVVAGPALVPSLVHSPLLTHGPLVLHG